LRPGQLVRALIQASDTPKNVAITVAPVQTRSVLTNARGMMRSVNSVR
jgi:hypothetical protein